MGMTMAMGVRNNGCNEGILRAAPRIIVIWVVVFTRTFIESGVSWTIGANWGIRIILSVVICVITKGVHHSVAFIKVTGTLYVFPILNESTESVSICRRWVECMICFSLSSILYEIRFDLPT